MGAVRIPFRYKPASSQVQLLLQLLSVLFAKTYLRHRTVHDALPEAPHSRASGIARFVHREAALRRTCGGGVRRRAQDLFVAEDQYAVAFVALGEERHLRETEYHAAKEESAAYIQGVFRTFQ